MWRHIALHLRPVIHENHDAHACRARYGNQEVLPVLRHRTDLKKIVYIRVSTPGRR